MSTQADLRHRPFGVGERFAQAPQLRSRGDAGASSSVVRGGVEAFDPLAKPTRLVGVQGVRLGASFNESNLLLAGRGWTLQGDGTAPAGRAAWRKGGLTLTMTAERGGRIDSIHFDQAFESGEGQFDVRELRRELIERFGPPMFDPFGDRTPAPGAKVQLQWSESPHARSYASFMAATPAQKQQINDGPRLDANFDRTRLNLSFHWRGLTGLAAAEQQRRERDRAEAAPGRRPTLD